MEGTGGLGKGGRSSAEEEGGPEEEVFGGAGAGWVGRSGGSFGGRGDVQGAGANPG